MQDWWGEHLKANVLARVECAHKAQDHAVFVYELAEILLWRFGNQATAVLLRVPKGSVAVVRGHRRFWQLGHLHPCVAMHHLSCLQRLATADAKDMMGTWRFQP
jgi:hypothetical protein